MEIGPSRRETVKSTLKWLLSGDEVDHYADLGNVIPLIQTEPSWQAMAAAGIHALVLLLEGKTDEDRSDLRNLADAALEPMRNTLNSLLPRQDETVIDAERLHKLFHARFGFGSLLLVDSVQQSGHAGVAMNSRQSEALDILLEMAGTDLADFPDTAWTKFVAALYVLFLCSRGHAFGDTETLFLMTEAGASNSVARIAFAKDRSKLLNKWAGECEDEDDSQQWEHPTLSWLALLAEASRALSPCKEVDASATLPNQCKRESVQYAAWEFGHLAGRLARHERWRHDPLGHTLDFLTTGLAWDDAFEFRRGGPQLECALSAALALFSEFHTRRVWARLREQRISLWKNAARYEGIPSSEIGPQCDLYWAMRIGFADAILERQEKLVPLPAAIESMPAIEQMGLTLLRMWRDIEELRSAVDARLPPDRSAIRETLSSKLPVWSKLPSDVTDSLTDGEYAFRCDSQSRAAIVSFHGATEKCLKAYAAGKLADYAVREHLWDRNTNTPDRWSLWQWGLIFEHLTDDRVAGAYPFSGAILLKVRTFVKSNWSGLDPSALKPLGKPLQEIQSFRNKAVHPEGPRPASQERSELEKVRQMVLGEDGNSSAIVQIVSLFGRSGGGGSNKERA